MDYLESLKVFRYVVETKSFSRAADMLGVAPPVVSRAIASLEQRLGSRLFNRTTRQVSLTEAAERIYEGCARVLDEMERIEQEAQTQAREPEGVLRLVAHTTTTNRMLVPLMVSFKRAHRKVGLDVTLTERPVDLVADGYDLGLVLPNMLTSDTTVTRLLARIPMAIVGSPSYFELHQRPLAPADLAEHTFVTMSPTMRKPSLTFLIDGEESTIPLRYEITSNNPEFNRDMVLEGFGLGIVPKALVAPELAVGRLCTLLDDFPLVDHDIEIRLAYNTRALMPAKVKAFIEHAIAYFADSANLPATGLAGASS